MLDFGLRLLQGLGSRAAEVLRSDVDLQLRDLLHQESLTAELPRRFALKLLERSVEAFASLFERLLAVGFHARRELVDGILEDLGEEPLVR